MYTWTRLCCCRFIFCVSAPHCSTESWCSLSFGQLVLKGMSCQAALGVCLVLKQDSRTAQLAQYPDCKHLCQQDTATAFYKQICDKHGFLIVALTPHKLIASFVLRIACFLKKSKRNINMTATKLTSPRHETARTLQLCINVDIKRGCLPSIICTRKHTNLKKSHLYCVYSAGEGSEVVKRYHPCHLLIGSLPLPTPLNTRVTNQRTVHRSQLYNQSNTETMI